MKQEFINLDLLMTALSKMDNKEKEIFMNFIDEDFKNLSTIEAQEYIMDSYRKTLIIKANSNKVQKTVKTNTNKNLRHHDMLHQQQVHYDHMRQQQQDHHNHMQTHMYMHNM